MKNICACKIKGKNNDLQTLFLWIQELEEKTALILFCREHIDCLPYQHRHFSLISMSLYIEGVMPVTLRNIATNAEYDLKPTLSAIALSVYAL